jgi:RNA 2',3'-cyclic 3'-phosphodiesterase
VRLFIAIEVGPAAMPAHAGGPRPPPEHLTLRFLGEMPSESVPGIKTALERVARESAPFDMVVEGVGAFPSPANPRVVWVGVTQGQREVCELAERVRVALEPERAQAPHETFVPHLTLFRVRSPSQRRRAVALLDGSEAPPTPRSVRVHELHLKESTLTPQGALHATLARWPLGGAGASSV